MTSISVVNTFDIFISYESSIQESVFALCQVLKKTFKVWLDIEQMYSGEDYIKKITDGLNDSKGVLCFATRDYVSTESCNKELSLAYAFKKPIVLLLCENLSVNSLGPGLAYFLINVPFLRIYEDKDFFQCFSGHFYNELVRILNYLCQTNTCPSNYTTLASDLYANRQNDSPFSKVIMSTLSLETSYDHQINHDQKHLIKQQQLDNKSDAATAEIIDKQNYSFANCSGCGRWLRERLANMCKCEFLQKKQIKRQLSLVEMDMPPGWFDIDDSDGDGLTQTTQTNDRSYELLNLRRIKATHTFTLPISKHLRRVTLLEHKRHILICDVANKSILEIDLNGKLISAQNPGDLLRGPAAICTDSNNRIYISDWIVDRIFVYTENLKYIRQLDQMVQVDTAYDLAMDNEKQVIYASDTNNNCISVLNRFNGHLLKTVNIEKPKDLVIYDQMLFVLSDRPDEPRICVMNKKTFAEIRVIKLIALCFIRGLYVDKEQNVYVSAYEHDVQHGSINWQSAYLYVFNVKGVMSDRLLLNLTGLWDMLVYEKRIYFIREKESTHYIVELD